MTSTAMQGRHTISSFVEHEHEELVAALDRIHRVAEELHGLPADRKAHSVADALRWVDETLKPHMAWEESWLCPEIDTRAQTTWVTRLVRFDHRQIAHQADRLKANQSHLDRDPSREAEAEVFADLLGLETLLRADLEREEYFLIPLLETEAARWTPEWRD
jgi:iron-sulfur cluster repair protein YtfE (RIC family)